MIRHKTTALAALVCSLVQVAAIAAPSANSLRTVAEQSGNKRTGRFEEVERLCPALPTTVATTGALF